MSAVSSRFRASPDAVATRVGDEIVLVHMKTDQIYSLNRTAARVWDLLCADCDRAEIERRMLDEFEVPSAELAGAIDDLVSSLVRGDLIVRSA